MRGIRVGSGYGHRKTPHRRRLLWVIPKPDVGRDDDWDRCQEWQDEIQPARFNGWNAAGEMIWNFIGVDGSSDWSVLWIGEEIGVPTVPTKPALAQM